MNTVLKNNETEKIQFNLLKALTYGNGTIKEDHISSLIAQLLNPKVNHGLGSKLLINFLIETTETTDLVRFMLINNNQDKWNRMEVVLEYPVKTINKKQKTRFIDIVLKFWVKDDIAEPDVIVAIENKIFDSSNSKNQLSDELNGLYNKYSNGAKKTVFHFVFLAPFGQSKGQEAFEDLQDEIELISQQKNCNITSHYLPWKADSSTSMQRLLQSFERKGSVETRYVLKSLSEMISIGFNIRNERVELIRNATFNVIKSVYSDYKNAKPLSEKGERYTFKINNKKIVSVHMVNKKDGQLETYARDTEKSGREYEQKIKQLGFDDCVIVRWGDKSVDNTIWLDFSLNQVSIVLKSLGFKALLLKIILEGGKYREKSKKVINTKSNVKVKVIKNIISNNICSLDKYLQEAENRLRGRIFTFGGKTYNALHFLNIRRNKDVFMWHEQTENIFLSFMFKLQETPFFGDLDIDISGMQAHQGRHRIGTCINLGRMMNKLQQRVMSIYFPKPDSNGYVMFGYQKSKQTDEYIDAKRIDVMVKGVNYPAPVVILYQELIDEFEHSYLFNSKFCSNDGKNSCVTLALTSQEYINEYILYLNKLGTHIIDKATIDIQSTRVKVLKNYIDN